MTRELSHPVGWIQDDMNDLWCEVESALEYGILSQTEEYVRGGEDLPTEAQFRRATLALRKLRALARDVRKGQRDGSA